MNSDLGWTGRLFRLYKYNCVHECEAEGQQYRKNKWSVVFLMLFLSFNFFLSPQMSSDCYHRIINLQAGFLEGNYSWYCISQKNKKIQTMARHYASSLKIPKLTLAISIPFLERLTNYVNLIDDIFQILWFSKKHNQQLLKASNHILTLRLAQNPKGGRCIHISHFEQKHSFQHICGFNSYYKINTGKEQPKFWSSRIWHWWWILES